MKRDQFEDQAAEWLDASIPENFLRAMHYSMTILGWYLGYLTKDAGESIPGEDWKAKAEGPSVELGALRAMLQELDMLPALFLKDADKAKADLAEVCHVLLPIVEERLANADDPVAKLSLRKAKLALANFIRAASPIVSRHQIQAQPPRCNRGGEVPDMHLAN